MNVYDIGDLIVLELPLTVDGVPTDPTTLLLSITDPDGITITRTWPTPPDIIHVGLGSFRYDYNPTKTGLYAYEWAGTGSAQADERGYFEVRPTYVAGTPPRLCSVGDLADFLQLHISNNGPALRAIEGATAAIQNYCHQQLVFKANDVVTLRARQQSALILPELPVVAVASVVENGSALVNDTDYGWEAESGLLWRWGSRSVWPVSSTVWGASGAIVVTYSHGYAAIPQDLREVCIRAASRAYQSGLRTAALSGVPGLASEQAPDFQVQYQPDTAAGGASSLGASAAPFLLLSEKEMLNPYRMKP